MKAILRLSICLAFVLSACTGAEKRGTVQTGEEVAKAAGERTRALQKEGKTGAIYARSGAEETPTAPPEPQPEPILAPLTVEILPDGSLRVDGVTLELEALKTQIGDKARAQPDTAVVVKASASTPVARIVEIVDTVKAQGISKVSVIKPTPEAPTTQPSKPTE